MGITVVEVITAGPIGPTGLSGAATTAGGTTKQVLGKASGTDHDVTWQTLDAVDMVFTSGTGIAAVTVDTAIDEVNTALGLEAAKIVTNATGIVTAQTQADLGVAAAAIAQTAGDNSAIAAAAAQLTADNAQTDATTGIANAAVAQAAADAATATAGDAYTKADTAISNAATNAGNITTLTNTVNANAPFIPYFDYVTGNTISVTGETYEQIARLTTPSRDAGIYKLDMGMLFSLDTNVRSGYFRFSINGGSTWTEVRREVTDITDTIPVSLPQVIAHAGGVADIIVQARKEDTGDVLTVHTINIMLERKI